MTPPRNDARRSRPTPARHPSMSDVALALAQKPHSEPRQSVKLNRTASGDVSIAVDVEDADVRAAEKLATQVFDRLVRKYPRKAT